jgi:AcrR family transcriptional regulator
VPARATPRRDQLFDDLVALLLAEGFAHLTLDDIAARLRCSKRTLYALAGSKEQLVRRAVVHFFKEATRRVEDAVKSAEGSADRVGGYLRAVAVELAPASPAFFDDVAAFAPADEEYRRNTRIAARRVRELVDEGIACGDFRAVHAEFVADVVTAVMVRIQRRELAAATGLTDGEAYADLAELLLHGLAAPRSGGSAG